MLNGRDRRPRLLSHGMGVEKRGLDSGWSADTSLSKDHLNPK